MAKVTICVAAYEAEAFIVPTLRQALAQSERDVVVDLAIEPPAQATLDACAVFAHDRRLRVHVNDRLRGWAGNFSALLSRVETPFFMFLPHDDLIHERYVETLLPLVEADDAVSVAYGDIRFVAHEGGFRRAVALREGGVRDRLASFLLAGAEAPPWRGVTRTRVRDHGSFPVDDHGGFLVECEWAFNLLAHGVARRSPRSLYFKRVRPDGVPTASRLRMLAPEDRMREALEDHRARLVERAARVLPDMADRALIECGIDASVLRRHALCGFGRFSPAQEQRLAQIRRFAGVHACDDARRFVAIALLAQSKVVQRLGAGRDAAFALATEAVEKDPENAEALQHLAWLVLERGHTTEALQLATRASDLAPHASGLEQLLRACDTAVLRTFES